MYKYIIIYPFFLTSPNYWGYNIRIYQFFLLVRPLLRPCLDRFVRSQALTTRLSKARISPEKSSFPTQNLNFLANFDQESPAISSCMSFCSMFENVCFNSFWTSASYLWKFMGSGLLWSHIFDLKLRHISNSRRAFFACFAFFKSSSPLRSLDLLEEPKNNIRLADITCKLKEHDMIWYSIPDITTVILHYNITITKYSSKFSQMDPHGAISCKFFWQKTEITLHTKPWLSCLPR